MGELTGGGGEQVGVTSTDDECANLVRRTDPKANGASRHQNSGRCYAEFKTTSSDTDRNWRHCVFRGKLDVFQGHCTVS